MLNLNTIEQSIIINKDRSAAHYGKNTSVQLFKMAMMVPVVSGVFTMAERIQLSIQRTDRFLCNSK